MIAKVSGVFSQARRYGWRVVEIERERTARPLSDFFATWKPAGCILECSGLASPPQLPKRGIPTVFLDPDPKTLSRPCLAVESDANAIASLAAKELVSAGCEAFVFVGWRERTGWSISRADAFQDALAADGFDCTIIDEPWSEELELQKRLAERLARMPRRIGVFAANDYVARQVAAAFDIAKLESPRDAALIGVVDDELICENQIPTLSSISIDFVKAGRLATDLLAEAVANPKLKPRRLSFGPLALVRRQSTRVVNSNDWRIVRAVERIRRHACAGLKAAKVRSRSPRAGPSSSCGSAWRRRPSSWRSPSHPLCLPRRRSNVARGRSPRTSQRALPSTRAIRATKVSSCRHVPST